MMLNSGVLDGVHEAAVGAQRGGSNHHHHHHHHHQRGLKKGPWTAAEDAILIEYVKKHGEGNWNGVQKNSGLARCGKSCRLRWANHLRPNLKKGSLSPEEEKLIMELHAKFGNKWARMASQLPGRTDNEIKNYWNTRMKRRQRAGLPVYPHDLQQEAPAATFQHHHQLRHSSSSSASSFSSLVSSSQPREPNNFSPSQLSLYDHIRSTFSSTSDHQNPTNNYFLQNNHHISSSLYSNPITQFHGNGGFAMPLSPVSPFGSSSSSALFNQSNIPNQAFIGQYNTHGGFRGYNNLSLSSMMIMGPPTYDPTPLVQGSNPELPSNQTLLSINGLGEDQMGGSGYTASEYHYEIAPVPPQGNSGLLDDVLVEAQNKSNKKAKSGDSCSSGWSSKEKGLMVEEEEEQREESAEEEAVDTVQVESKSSGENSADNQRDGSSSPSAIGMKQNEDPLEEMDDDLFSLLNFPSAPAVSESWYAQGCMSNRASMSGVVTSDNVSLEIQQNAPLTPSVKTNTAAASEVKRSLGSCYWNNMPGIC